MMAARRSFQTTGDNTPAMRPVERLPLRERQDNLFGQQQQFSANKPISSKSPFKKKPGVKADPCDVISLMIKRGQMAVEPQFCPPLCRASPGLAPLGATKLAKENAVAVLAEEEDCVFEKGLPDSSVSEVIEKDTEQRFGNCCITEMTQSEHARDIAGTVRIGYEGERTDTVSAQDQSISIGCLSGKSTDCVAQTAPDTPAVEHRVNGMDADVTFKSFSCSGLDLEIASVSLQPEESVLLLPEGPPVVSSCCSFQEECSDGLGFPQHADQSSRADHEDHAYCLLEHEDPSSRGTSFLAEPLIWTQHSRKTHQIWWTTLAKLYCGPQAVQWGTEATDVTADQSDCFAAQCLIGDQQSHDTAEIGLLADQSLASAEMSVADDQSLSNSQKSVAADQSQGVKKRRFEAASCVEARTPALGKTSHLMEPGPGYPWDAGDSPLGPHKSRLWMGNMESPMPPPQLNSTLIISVPNSAAATPQITKPETEALPAPAEEKLRPLQTPGGRADARSGPLKVNLRQMGELLLRASQNLVSPVECHSAATLTSPVRRVEHGVNTSGFYERKRQPSVAEACTNTDTLPWNVAPELMAGWSRQDLEQRLFSSLIMVEALSQQLASARTHRPPCAPPSETRERAAQTDHTELGQGVLYRQLYVRAQDRLQELDLQQDDLKRLKQQLRHGCTSVTALAAETERALSSVNEMGQMANDDQHRLSQQMSQVRALYGRFREVLKRSNERVQRCHQEKLLMEQQRDEALRTRDAALAVLERLQSRHAAQVCELEKSLGSHLELIPALSHACREQGLLKEEYTQSLQAADDLLQDTLHDHARLSDELCKAHSLLRQTGPVLQKLHEKAAVARQVQNQLEQDNERIQDELDQMSSHLHEAQKQIGDLNLQITILTSEMGVLRQRLSEEEEDRSHTEMKNTELSAALSSTQASCSVLQQALSTQTHRLKEVESSLSQRVEELGGALADRDSQLALSQKLLQELQSQLSNVREINEFLQMESQVSREQMAHSEGLVKSHLQSLRERNLECEDLKRELCALWQQRNSLQEEVRSTQETAQRHLQEMETQLSMASSEITMLHHKVYKLTSALNTSLNTAHSSQKPDRPTFTVPPINSAPPLHTAHSFVDSVMVAVSAEEPQASEKDECLVTALGSGNSAFTRVPATAPKMQDAVEESEVLEQLKGLGQAVSQLVCKVVCVREQGDRQCEDLRLTVSSQQEALDSQATRHRLEVVELKEQVSRLQAQVEESTAAQLQKAQEERTFRKLCRDLDESKELAQQQKWENKELRREVSELRCSLLQAQSELQLLREELSDGQATKRLHPLQERLRLQQEVEKLRSRLQESEESRSKLLERAKRHKVVLEGNQRQLEKELYILDQTIRTVKQTLLSLPDVVKGCEQLKDLVTYLE
ncbi:hypothetical protein GJAV_G00067680 [Gymnothorax javanicus]|nr:hypothetical protein GJAV_G00067680 [Gymnothorax javanicus]